MGLEIMGDGFTKTKKKVMDKGNNVTMDTGHVQGHKGKRRVG